MDEPDARGRPRRWSPRGLVGVATGLIIGMAGTAVVAWTDGELRDTKVISRIRQPASVRYPDGSIHHAGVVRVRSWILNRHRPYEVVIGRDPGLSYGHSVTFEATGESPPRISGAEWRPDGVRIRLDSGHEVFVPAQKFLGGR
ncbi:hypothetical protein [Actinomadura rudentiformis]|uniref:Uncharacterized protein n=1 Tax=Actinomadura rudentiformis TaxID=359158 RepID=A0A6H9YN27_9ACTN|nr:hypothetical protein [Actinomadura rudentiformis]KAB2341127.1 hypothetical protein F8566_43365 [Actinomadura rudentiformis]